MLCSIELLALNEAGGAVLLRGFQIGSKTSSLDPSFSFRNILPSSADSERDGNTNRRSGRKMMSWPSQKSRLPPSEAQSLGIRPRISRIQKVLKSPSRMQSTRNCPQHCPTVWTDPFYAFFSR